MDSGVKLGLRLLVAVAALLLPVMVAELISRAVGHDWWRREEALEAVPICYRQPRVQSGSVFFRREGPDRWVGNPISDHFEALRHPDDDRSNPYAGLAPISVEYDRQGFRNPLDLVDWKIVVVGDSFVELGHLADADLSTNVLAQQLGVPVRNLGVSNTATPTHNHYLANYGGSPELDHAVLAFFEGNDLREARWERSQLARFRQTGRIESREIEPQTSLIGYLGDRFRQWWNLGANSPPQVQREAQFVGGDSETPVDLYYTPPESLPPGARALLSEELAAWAATAHRLDARPWLLYVPAKIRVLQEQLRFEDDSMERFRDWRPGRLRAEIVDLAAEHGITAIDPTPALQATSAEGLLTFNSIWDSHFNDLGSRVVGEVLADALGPGVE